MTTNEQLVPCEIAVVDSLNCEQKTNVFAVLRLRDYRGGESVQVELCAKCFEMVKTEKEYGSIEDLK